MDYEKIGSFIAAKRKEKGMTQKDLAELLGVTDRAVSKWERAKSFPDVQILKPLCETLGVSVSELLDGEVKPHLHLTKEEADRFAITGITAYTKRGKRKQWVLQAVILLVLIAIIVCAYLLWQSRQPVDFAKGDYEIGRIIWQPEFPEFSKQRSFVIEGDFAEETKQQIKRILADTKAAKEYDKYSVKSKGYVEIEGIGTFYTTEYIDARSGKCYPLEVSPLTDMEYYISNYLADRDYVYKGKRKEVILGDRTLTLADGVEITEKPQEAVLESFREDLRRSYKDYPGAYIKHIDILSMERITEAECKKWDDAEFEWFQKEIDYRDLYDYRFYRVEFDWKYTEERMMMGPQIPEGKYYRIFLIGSSNGEPYRIYQQTMPFGLD